MIQRRSFITLLGGAAATWPMAARGQQPAMPVIGFLRSTAAASSAQFVSAFRQGLKEAGFVDGENVAIDYRWGDDQLDRLPGLAVDLVRRRPAVIIGNILATQATTGRRGRETRTGTPRRQHDRLADQRSRHGGRRAKVTLVNLRAGQDSGFFFLQPTVDALTYAGDDGIDVVNMSYFIDPWLFNCRSNPATRRRADGAADDRRGDATRARLRAPARRHLDRRGGERAHDLAQVSSDETSPDFPPGRSTPAPSTTTASCCRSRATT